jgi:type IV secretion system protein VirD4
MSTDELAVMDRSKCILQVQGVKPFFSDKFNITKHPQYKYLLEGCSNDNHSANAHVR